MPEAAELLEKRLRAKVGAEAVHLDRYSQKAKGIRFPVLTRDQTVEWSTVLSKTLKQVPTFTVEYVFVDPLRLDEVRPEVAAIRAEIAKRQKRKQKPIKEKK
jgi:hypothetical protein